MNENDEEIARLRWELKEARGQVVKAREQLVSQMLEVEVARQTAEDASRAKARFLANMSHEIRTPINAIVGIASLLRETPLSDEQAEYFQIIINSSSHLLAIINDILDFSKIEAGQLELENTGFSLIQAVEESLDLVTSGAAEREVELVYRIGLGVPAELEGDISRLRQVLINLLGNAVKFSDPGGTVELDIDAEPVGADEFELHFTVLDDGPGFDPNQTDKLFQPFQQLGAETYRQRGGTGLGLAISASLVEAMGGEISARNRDVGGAKVAFSIRARGSGQALVSPLSDAPEVRGNHALIVDDSEITLDILGANLAAWGMQYTRCTTGAEAIAQAGDRRPDVLLLDFHLPDMTGLELAGRLRRLYDEPPPVILVSGLETARKEMLRSDVPVTAFLNKPLKISRLRNAVADAVLARDSAERERRSPDRVPDDQFASRYPLRILLAEDNPVNQKVAEFMLTKFGYAPLIANNGIEAVEIARSLPRDLILMDLQMPVMDGFEALQAIRSGPVPESQPRVVALTADATVESLQAAREAGFDDYVLKPVNKSDLAKVLIRTAREPRADPAC